MTNTSKAVVLNAYAEFGLGANPVKAWATDHAGPKPTAEMLLNYHGLGARHGKQCLAGAMMLRPHGATGSEIVVACGAPQLNKMRGLCADALVRRDMTAGQRNGQTVYKLTVTQKGEKRIANFVSREAALVEAGKADGASKATKATPVAKAAKKPTSKPRKPTGDKLPANVMTDGAATVTVPANVTKPDKVTDHPLLPPVAVNTDQPNT